MTTLIRNNQITVPDQTLPVVYAVRANPTAEWRFDGDSTNDLVDKSGNGNKLTLIGAPSFTTNGLQSANNTIGAQTPVAETAAMTLCGVFSTPVGIGPASNAARAVGTYQGFSPNKMGASLLHQYNTATESTEQTNGRIAINGSGDANIGTPPSQLLATRSVPRFAALVIDPDNGWVLFLCPLYETALRKTLVTGLAARPLNGNLMINAWKAPGDASGQGGILTRAVSVFNSALTPAQLRAEYNYWTGLYGAI